MPLTLIPHTEPVPLQRRLRQLLSRFRRVVVVREGARIAALALLLIAACCWLDWKYHLPAFLRSLFLVGLLAGTVAQVYRRIVAPLKRERTILAMARRVERHYPEFNDSLLSAIQFMEMPEGDSYGSAEMRRETIDRAVADAGEFDLDAAVKSRGLARSLLAFFVVGTGCIWIGNGSPAVAETALTRLLFPFGALPWPAKTSLEIVAPATFPHRMARGEAFELQVKVRGLIPERAKVGLWLDGGSPSEQAYAIPKNDPTPGESSFSVRFDSNRIPRGFQFRVRANDADTGWQAVAVLPPPVLVPRDGRPSPQIHLDYPAYTEWLAVDLPDGGSVIEAVTGTRVSIKAAVDRPIARVILSYRPEQSRLPLAAFLAVVGARTCWEEAASLGLSREVWNEIPVQLSEDGRLIDIDFVPRLPGSYLLRMEDDTGLGSERLFDLRIQTDPTPVLDIQRPSAGRDSLAVVADAEFTLAALAQDKIFALRRVYLEYRTGRSDPYRRVDYFDSEATGRIVPHLASLMRLPLSLPAGSFPRLQAYAVDRRISVRDFTQIDGSPLKEGDVLFLRMGAVDYDDVTLNKPPGLSPEIELQIVSKGHLEASVQQTLAQMRNDLLQLREAQHEARTKVQEVLKQLPQPNPPRRDDVERLNQAEIIQRQIRAKIGAADEGLLAQLERLKQMAIDNRLPRSSATQRANALAAELNRLAEEELSPLEPLLGEARKQREGRAGKTDRPETEAGKALARAERHQKEIEETLMSLLERLEPWSGAGEVRGEARSIRNELDKQADALNRLQQSLKPTTGSKRDDLPEGTRNELDRAAIRPERLADRVRQLLEKIERLADEKEQSLREKLDLLQQKQGSAKGETPNLRESTDALKAEIEALRNALKRGDGKGLRKRVRDVPPQIRNNQIGDAQANQKAVGEGLDELIEALSERRKAGGEEADLLQKKKRNADAQLGKIGDDQERLQKKIEAASGMADPNQREEELRKLAPEQQRLERESRDLAQELSRLNADDAAQELRRAARQMEEDRQQLERGQPPLNPEDALQKIDEAQAQLDRERGREEDELLRENLAETADLLRALRDRQQSADRKSVV